jgi:hypothetical protein
LQLLIPVGDGIVLGHFHGQLGRAHSIPSLTFPPDQVSNPDFNFRASSRPDLAATLAEMEAIFSIGRSTLRELIYQLLVARWNIVATTYWKVLMLSEHRKTDLVLLLVAAGLAATTLQQRSEPRPVASGRQLQLLIPVGDGIVLGHFHGQLGRAHSIPSLTFPPDRFVRLGSGNGRSAGPSCQNRAKWPKEQPLAIRLPESRQSSYF